MRAPVERRCVLTGLAALSAVGCSPRAESRPAAPAPVSDEVIDLSDLETRNGGRLGFVVQDAATGRKLGWRGDERFVYCSTFKMYLAAATLLRVQAGEERLDRAIPITRADMISHAPVTQPAVGSTLTIEQLMKGTVEVSDNPAANILIREMGGIAVWRAWWPTFGDTTTLISRLEPDLNTALPDDPRDTCLPDQTLANIRELAFSDRLTPEHDQMIQGWLTASPTGPNRIKAGAPQGWTVAHKTGTGVNGTANDIGVAFPVSGSPVVLATYFTGATQASDDQRDAVIAEATCRVFKALGRD